MSNPHHEIDKKAEYVWSNRGMPIDELETIAEDLHNKSLAINYQLGIGIALTIKGYRQMRQGRTFEALNELNKANAILSHFSDSKWNIQLQWGLFRIYELFGLRDISLEYHSIATKIAKRLNDNDFGLVLKRDLGSFYVKLGEKRGLKILLSALDDCKRQNNQRLLPTILLNLSATMSEFKEYTHSIEYAQALLELNPTKDEIVAVYVNLGIVYLDLGDYKQAKSYLMQGLEIAREQNLKSREGEVIIVIANYYNLKNQDEEAIQWLQLGLDLAKMIDYKSIIMKIYKLLYEIYTQRGDWQKALHYHEQFHKVEKLIFNEESDIRVRILETHKKVEELQKIHEAQRHEYMTLTELKDTLLSNVSHDLKSPLATIKVNLHLARKTLEAYGLTEQDHLRFLDNIDRQTGYMAELITDVLDMARLETDAIRVERQYINIYDGIKIVCHEFAEQAKAKSIDVSYELVDKLNISVDAAMFKRLIENFVNNAIKYTPENGYIEIGASSPDGSHVHIYIKDSGVGIATEELSKIFDRFYRVPHTQDLIEGTGLGLAICQNIVKKHNGKIEVESTLGQGTTFTIILPVS